MKIVIVNNGMNGEYIHSSRSIIYSKANQFKETVEYININNDGIFAIIDKINKINPDEVYLEYIYGENTEVIKYYINLIVKGINCKTIYIPDFETVTDSSYGSFIEFGRYKQI